MSAQLGKQPALAKTPMVEWQLCEDDHTWQLAQSAPLEPTAHPRRWFQHWPLLAATGALLLLLGAGGWLWHQARLGENQIKGELQIAVESDQWRSQQTHTINATHTGPSPDIALLHDGESEPSPENVHTQLIDFGEDWAIVRVTTVQGTLPYRQTRLYRQAANGWYEATPSILLWGAPRTLETSHFLFRYHALDGAAVAAAAEKLDTLYPEVAANYALDPAQEHKVEIWVSPEYSWQKPIGVTPGAALKLASPALYLAPTQISEGDILAQAIVLDLLRLFADQSMQRHVFGEAHDAQAMPRVDAFLQALGLWQLSNTELPLAALYKPTIQWLYGDLQRGYRLKPPIHTGLCPLHQLWKAAPYIIHIPLFCGDLQQLQGHGAGYYPYASPHSLAEIHIFPEAAQDEPYRGLTETETETAGLVTVIDYAAATYGRESLPRLISNAAASSSWQTLIPAAFGVSAEQFNAGWQAYLRDHYEISAAVIP